MNYDDFLHNIKFQIREEHAKKYENGIEKNVKEYVCKKFSADTVKNNGFICEDEEAQKYIDDYYKKTEEDYSAKDCAEIALMEVDKVFIEDKSRDHLERKIREVFSNEYRDQVYLKKVKKFYPVCVKGTVKDQVIKHPAVKEVIERQIKRVIKKDPDTPEYRQYKLEKMLLEAREKIYEEIGEGNGRKENLDSMISGIYTMLLLHFDEMRLMVKAIYSLLFTDFNFEAYNKDYETVVQLQEEICADDQYKELNRILSARDYEEKYYKISPSSKLLDILADKVVERLKETKTENEQ